MKKIAIIGIGTITKHYEKGIAESDFFNLCAICDIMEKPASVASFDGYPFYTDYKMMLEAEKPDYIMISTPPLTHFSIIRYALYNGVNVIVEKPAVLDIKEYDYLASLAADKGLVFDVAFHWQNGIEVEQFNTLYDPKYISEISVVVCDPYSSDGVTINDNKVKLMGTWFDSGVNILSMIRMWLPLNKVCVEKADVKKCSKTSLPVFIDLKLIIDDVKVNISIDWRKNINNKCTEVIYDGRKIVINNSLQRIEDGDKIIECCKMPRLEQHYYTFFKNYNGAPNTASVRDIHRVLLEVANYYEKASC